MTDQNKNNAKLNDEALDRATGGIDFIMTKMEIVYMCQNPKCMQIIRSDVKPDACPRCGGEIQIFRL